MKNAHCRSWNMARKFENHGKCEIHTLGCEIWRGKLKKGGKFLSSHLQSASKFSGSILKYMQDLHSCHPQSGPHHRTLSSLAKIPVLVSWLCAWPVFGCPPPSNRYDSFDMYVRSSMTFSLLKVKGNLPLKLPKASLCVPPNFSSACPITFSSLGINATFP